MVDEMVVDEMRWWWMRWKMRDGETDGGR